MAPKEKDCSNKTSGKAMVRRRSNSKSPAASPTRLGDLPDKLAPRAHPPPPREPTRRRFHRKPSLNSIIKQKTRPWRTAPPSKSP
uniref:Uncharacterized protein n=1 Tax=Oryza barthii TaxID=65489 RepID=A0A0D3H5K7_9ORYZ